MLLLFRPQTWGEPVEPPVVLPPTSGTGGGYRSVSSRYVREEEELETPFEKALRNPQVIPTVEELAEEPSAPAEIAAKSAAADLIAKIIADSQQLPPVTITLPEAVIQVPPESGIPDAVLLLAFF
jgi:hypothetical protein